MSETRQEVKEILEEDKKSTIGSKIKVSKIERTDSQDSEITRIQKKILLFFGNLPCSYYATSFQSSLEEIGSKLTTVDSSATHLIFGFPFKDCKMDVALDTLIPRVVDLSLHGTHRKTRMAACETLHVLILMMIGKSSEKTKVMLEREPMKDLYNKIFPALIKLANDGDNAIQDLLHPLLLQCIHWFTSNQTYESPETMLLLDAIMESKDGGPYLKEFLKWSIKQIPKDEMDQKSFNPKSIFKRLFSLWIHPNPLKRLRASQYFNHLYTIFREEQSLVNMFTFEILIHVIKCLALTHYDDSDNSDVIAENPKIGETSRTNSQSQTQIIFNR